MYVDVQIINKQAPRKVETLSDEEKMERQVEILQSVSSFTRTRCLYICQSAVCVLLCFLVTH